MWIPYLIGLGICLSMKIEVINILDNFSAINKYYIYFKRLGFDVKRDLKNFKISNKEYQSIILDLSNPKYFLMSKGILQKTQDNLTLIKKLYLREQNRCMRIIALITIEITTNNIYILPFHIYVKNKKIDLTIMEENIMRKIIVDIDTKGDSE